MPNELDSNLLRLALGVPFAGIGGLLGYATAPKNHGMAGATRGAGIGYMTGLGLGMGTQLGNMITPSGTSNVGSIPYWALGGTGGALLGAGIGKVLQGEPQWEQKRKFREELLGLLQEEHAKLKSELTKKQTRKVGSPSPLRQLLQAKQLSDRKDYTAKHTKLRSLMDRYPDDFYVDSVSGDIAGITHRPTGFKIHAPLRVVPSSLKSTTTGVQHGETANVGSVLA